MGRSSEMALIIKLFRLIGTALWYIFLLFPLWEIYDSTVFDILDTGWFITVTGVILAGVTVFTPKPWSLMVFPVVSIASLAMIPESMKAWMPIMPSFAFMLGPIGNVIYSFIVTAKNSKTAIICGICAFLTMIGLGFEGSYVTFVIFMICEIIETGCVYIFCRQNRGK